MKIRILLLFVFSTFVLSTQGQQCLVNGIDFITQSEVDNFRINNPDCSDIIGSVSISGSDISNLDSLTYIHSIGGELGIYSTESLSSLDGLENLEKVNEGLWFADNSVLESIEALSNLRDTISSLGISNCDSLLNLHGLERIKVITSSLNVDGNYKLQNFIGLDSLSYIGLDIWMFGSEDDQLNNFEGLERLEYIGFGVNVSDYPRLKNFDGLSGLQTIASDLFITGCDSLNNISALSNLTLVNEGIWIEFCPLLESLDGLQNVNPDSINIVNITNNESLSFCAVQSICQYSLDPAEQFVFNNNAPGCNTTAEVETDCFVTTCLPDGITFTSQEEIDLFPFNYSFCGEIEGDVFISGSDISNVDSLYTLNGISGNLTINSNELLNDLTGLSNLNYINGELTINENAIISSLDGLQNIENTTITALTIQNNPLLSDCSVEQLCFYLTDPLNVQTINNNASGCDTEIEVQENCGLFPPCLPDGITFSSQSDVDNFKLNNPHCNNIIGDVIIAGADIENLDSLIYITNMQGNFYLSYLDQGNTSLVNIEGLSNLTNIDGYFNLGTWNIGNPVLTSIEGLDNLQSVGGDLNIMYNEELYNLLPLENLTNVGGSVLIQNNGGLLNLTGLQNLASFYDMVITQNSGLYTLAGLPEISHYPGSLIVSNNESLLNLSGLNAVDSVQSNLSIDGNASLTSLSILNNLSYVGGSFTVNNSPLIEDLGGLDQLFYIGSTLSLQNNTVLNNLNSLENLTTVGGNLLINDNPELTNISGIQSFQGSTSYVDVYITGNTSLNECSVWSVCNYFNNSNTSFYIENNAEGCNSEEELQLACESAEITLILSTQDEVDNFLLNCPSCPNFYGNIIIQGNEINNLDSLIYLEQIFGNLIVGDSIGNPFLTNMSGLDNLILVTGDVFFINNPLITSIPIEDGENDASSLMMASLASIGGDLVIMDNEVLIDLSGLESLTEIGGDLIISNNQNLVSLIGLGNIDPESILNLYIDNNPLLSTCQVQSVCSYISNPTGELEIYDNAVGCNNEDEVYAICSVGIFEEELSNEIQIYPNPAQDILYIKSDKDIDEVRIYNLQGQLKLVNNKKTIDLSSFNSGIYFIEFTIGNRKLREKFVIQ